MQNRIEVFKQMLESDPDNSMVLFGLANEYQKLGDWPSTVATLEDYLAQADDEGGRGLQQRSAAHLGPEFAGREVALLAVRRAHRMHDHQIAEGIFEIGHLAGETGQRTDLALQATPVSLDQALTAALLRRANSAMSGSRTVINGVVQTGLNVARYEDGTTIAAKPVKTRGNVIDALVVGDAAVLPWKKDRPVPGVAQGGIQAGRHAARTIRRRRGKRSATACAISRGVKLMPLVALQHRHPRAGAHDAGQFGDAALPRFLAIQAAYEALVGSSARDAWRRRLSPSSSSLRRCRSTTALPRSAGASDRSRAGRA
mgnify:CR=1 FL=1